MHRNYKLMLILGGLLLVSSLLSLNDGKKRPSAFRTDLFNVPDTAAIRSVSINNNGLQLVRTNRDSWKVNGKYDLDPGLKTILLAVLNQVMVRRPVSKTQSEEIARHLKRGTKVSVVTGNGDFTFYAGGNPARTQSYFMMENSNQPYIVEIPGYRNYISGIFELTELQWRDRRLFNTHWRSLQSLKVSYPGNSRNDIDIFFENKFFRIRGVEKMDTTALMTYLEPFAYFEANEFIPRGFSSTFDSLSDTQPLAIIELNEINQDNNQRLTVFHKLKDNNYLLTLNKEGDLSLVDFERVRPLLPRRSDFKR